MKLRRATRGWILIGVVCFVGAAAFLKRPQEPVYQGRSLSDWVNRLNPRATDSGEAGMAIRAMGPEKVIPCLLRKVRHADSLYRRFYCAPRRFQGVIQKWLPKPQFVDLDRIGCALSQLGPSAVPQLVGALHDRNEEVQVTALYAIMKMRTEGDAAIPALIQMLEATNQLCYIAIDTLHAMGPGKTQSIPALIKLLSNRPGAPHAAWLLGEIGPEAHAAIPALTRLMNDARSGAREEAATALWRISLDTNAIPVLAEELDKTPYVATRWNILRALRQIGPAAKPAIPSILRVISNPHADAAPEGWQALRKIDPRGEQAVAAWSELLHDTNPQVREAARTALNIIDPNPARAVKGDDN